ncbi:hypothetical protein [Streptomyces tibetensis]
MPEHTAAVPGGASSRRARTHAARYGNGDGGIDRHPDVHKDG